MTRAPWPPGLCADCRHAQRLASKRSHFVRCRKSDEDGRFPRYPALPVVACEGYEAGARRDAGRAGDPAAP